MPTPLGGVQRKEDEHHRHHPGHHLLLLLLLGLVAAVLVIFCGRTCNEDKHRNDKERVRLAQVQPEEVLVQRHALVQERDRIEVLR